MRIFRKYVATNTKAAMTAVNTIFRSVFLSISDALLFYEIVYTIARTAHNYNPIREKYRKEILASGGEVWSTGLLRRYLSLIHISKKGFVCKICGYVYEGDTLPEDYVCPLCKHGPEDFEPLG